MPGILIVLIILLCFAIYIDVERQKYDQKTSEAYKRIIQLSAESEPIYQQILTSANLALKTDNPTDSNTAAMDAIGAYNKLAALLDVCKADLLLVKSTKLQSAGDALAIVQTRVNDGKARVDDAVRYVKSLPLVMFNMAKCPVPCHALNAH